MTFQMGRFLPLFVEFITVKSNSRLVISEIQSSKKVHIVLGVKFNHQVALAAIILKEIKK